MVKLISNGAYIFLELLNLGSLLLDFFDDLLLELGQLLQLECVQRVSVGVGFRLEYIESCVELTSFIFQDFH